MNIIDAIKSIGQIKDAMQAGKEVADPKGWKQLTVTANKIAVIIGAILMGLRLAGIDVPLIDNETITLITTALAMLLLAGNNISAMITSKKVGTKPDATTAEAVAAVIDPTTTPTESTNGKA
jgi:hypothetical protein